MALQKTFPAQSFPKSALDMTQWASGHLGPPLPPSLISLVLERPRSPLRLQVMYYVQRPMQFILFKSRWKCCNGHRNLGRPFPTPLNALSRTSLTSAASSQTLLHLAHRVRVENNSIIVPNTMPLATMQVYLPLPPSHPRRPCDRRPPILLTPHHRRWQLQHPERRYR